MFNLVPFNRRTRDIENMFSRFFEDNLLFPSLSTGIKVDVKEKENEFLVEAEIPGVNKDQIQINYDNNYLTISVETKNEVNEEKENYVCRERRYGKSSRSFYIENIAEDKIEAKYENGILFVTLPKNKEVKTKKQIDIR